MGCSKVGSYLWPFNQEPSYFRVGVGIGVGAGVGIGAALQLLA